MDRPTSASTAPYVTLQQTNRQTHKRHTGTQKKITLPAVEGYLKNATLQVCNTKTISDLQVAAQVDPLA